MNVLTDLFGTPPVMSMGNYEFQETGNELLQSGLSQFMSAAWLLYAGLVAMLLIISFITESNPIRKQ